MTDYAIKIGYQVDASGLKAARAEINKIDKSLKDSKKSGEAFGKSLVAGARIATTAILAVGAAALKTAKDVQNTFSEIQKINDFSLFTGAAVEGLAELEARAISVGVNFDQLSKILTRQQEKIKEGNEIFEELGLNLDRLSILDPAEAFQEIVNAIANIDNNAIKAKGITQLLGESGVNALKLAGSLEEINKQLQEARSIGLIVSQKDLDNASTLDELTNKISASWKGLSREVARTFGPSLISVFDTISETLQKLNPRKNIEVYREELEKALKLQENINNRRKEGLEVSKDEIDAAKEYANNALRLVEIEERRKEIEERRAQISNLPGVFGFSQVQAQIEARKELERNSKELNQLEAEELRLNERQLQLEKELNAEKEKQKQKQTEIARLQREQREETERLKKEQEKLLNDAKRSFQSLSSDLKNEFRSILQSIGFEKFLDIIDSPQNKINSFMSAYKDAIKELNIQTVNDFLNSLEDDFVQLLRIVEQTSKIKIFDGPNQSLEEFLENLKLIFTIAQENKKILNRSSQIEEILGLLHEQFEIEKLIISGQIQSQEELDRYIRQNEELRNLKEQFPDLTEEEIAAMTKAIRIQQRRNDELLRTIEAYNDFIEDLARDIGSSISRSIVDALETGRFEFRNFFRDVGRILIESGIQQLIALIFSPQGNGQSLFTQVLTSIFGNFIFGKAAGSAGGGDGGGAAFGAVVNTPQTYGGKFMAEQGPEAIMPLGRDSSGRLGVRIADKGSNATVINFTNNITVNGSDNPQETAEKTARALEQLVDRKIKAQLVNQQRAGNLLNAMPRGF